MVSVLASSTVDRAIETQLDLTKDLKIGIYCFSATCTSAALRRKSKYWWAQDNLLEWSDMFILLFPWNNTIKIQLSVMVWYKSDNINISWNVTCSRQTWYWWEMVHLALNSNYSLLNVWPIYESHTRLAIYYWNFNFVGPENVIPFVIYHIQKRFLTHANLGHGSLWVACVVYFYLGQ